MKKFFLATFIAAALAACTNNATPDTPSNTEPDPPRIGFNVIKVYPHDTGYFTEGLEFHEGQLYESSGSGGSDGSLHPSSFGVVDLATGKVNAKATLDNNTFFGEGITFFNGKVYQLTYKEHKGFVYDAATFRKLQEFSYPGEGWALTHDSVHLIMSDGSSNLQFLDPNTLRVVSIVGVTDNNGPVSNINELEYVDGYIFANQWQTNYILKIDVGSGKVVGKMNLDSLAQEAAQKYNRLSDLNGIAYNPASNTLFVTGKLWPSIYEIKLN